MKYEAPRLEIKYLCLLGHNGNNGSQERYELVVKELEASGWGGQETAIVIRQLEMHDL